MGVVMRVHDEAPAEGVEVKPVQTVMDVPARCWMRGRWSWLDGWRRTIARRWGR